MFSKMLLILRENQGKLLEATGVCLLYLPQEAVNQGSLRL